MIPSKPNIPGSKLKRKAIGYARVSSERQMDEGNINMQIEAINTYVANNNLDLIEILQEAKSASKTKKSSGTELLTDRPVLQDILDKAKRHEFTDLILYNRDRLSRNFTESLVIKSLFIKAKITIHYVTTSEKISDTNEYIDKFTDLVFLNIAMLEAGMIGQRAKSGQKVNIQNGFYAGGHISYGYNVVPHVIKKKKVYIKNYNEELIVKRIFTLYTLRYSYSEICEILKSEFPCESRLRFNKSTIYQILNNEMYTGSLIWNRKSKHQLGENDTVVRSVQDEKIEIVSYELFERVHEIKDTKSSKNSLNMSYNSNFLLKGKLICGNCHKPLKCKNNGKNKRSVYYCACNDEILKNGRRKWTISIPKDNLEHYVFKTLHDRFAKPITDNHIFKNYYNTYYSLLEEEKIHAYSMIAKRKEEIEDLENTIYQCEYILQNKLSYQKENASIYNEDFFKSFQDTISLASNSVNNLKNEIKKYKAISNKNVLPYDRFVSTFKEIFTYFTDTTSSNIKDLQISELRLRRMLIDDIIDKIIVNYSENGDTLSVYLRIPDISTNHNFEFMRTCPINSIISI